MYNENIILTTQDILEKEFKIDARGYRAQEVDKFLDTIIKDYTEFNKMVKILKKENNTLMEENNALRGEIRKLRELQSICKEEKENSNKPVNNIDLMQRLSQLEKIVYGENKN